MLFIERMTKLKEGYVIGGSGQKLVVYDVDNRKRLEISTPVDVYVFDVNIPGRKRPKDLILEGIKE